jgi:DNA replication protein DnaC
VEPYLDELAKHELELRRERRVERRLRQSWLPREKPFRTLELSRFPAALRLQIERLQRGAFLDQAVNVVAIGKPGVGKSHVAAAGGYELVQRGDAVLWTSTATLMQRLLAAKRDLRWPQEVPKLDRFAGGILDDSGYVHQEREEMEVLFTFLAL